MTYTLSFSDGGPAVPTSYALVRRSDGRFTVFRGDERGGVGQATAEDGETQLEFATEAQACEWIWNEILWWREFEARRANRDQSQPMAGASQEIQVARDGVVHDASVAWRYEHGAWAVRVASGAFEPVEVRADDAFEALCAIRDVLEPGGWRIGVAGAQADVWPSGMSRDQGGGVVAYRMTVEGAAGVVDTFASVDPATVVTLSEQRAGIDRLSGEGSR
ncbi:hypothetical protein [Microbacterium sp. 13-71-7]|uniref:hypothetical protein n=1 Tax=Microbacterium sp. 13-71-7 TaxID=1970399 RepID=UPI0025E671C0|nr:hypothetical protein [Microbacterium sp. 13-71-7]